MNAYKQQRTLYRSMNAQNCFEKITSIEPRRASYYSLASRDKFNKQSWTNDYNSRDDYDWWISHTSRYEVYTQKKRS